MKKVKFAVIAVLIAFTLVSLARADDFKSKPQFKKVVILTLDKAMLIPGLVTAIYAQLDEEVILNLPNTGNYTAVIQYEGSTYRITGTRLQWVMFFNLQGISPVILKKGHGIT